MRITKKQGEPRPDWLKDNDVISNRKYHNLNSTFRPPCPADCVVKSDWEDLVGFDIPNDHPYALATAAGLKYWPGGDEAPADWDRTKPIMFRDGNLVGYTPLPEKPAFDPAKPVRTRDGRPVRIICTDRLGSRPLVGLITDDSGKEIVAYRQADGTSTVNTKGDFINVPVRETVSALHHGVQILLTLEDGKPVAVELADAA